MKEQREYIFYFLQFQDYEWLEPLKDFYDSYVSTSHKHTGTTRFQLSEVIRWGDLLISSFAVCNKTTIQRL